MIYDRPTPVLQCSSLWWFSESKELVKDVVRVAKRCKARGWSGADRRSSGEADAVERDPNVLSVKKTLPTVFVVQQAPVSYKPRPSPKTAIFLHP